MKQYSDTTCLELSFAEISRMTTGLVSNLDKHIKFDSPIVIIQNYIEVVRKLNNILKENGFDHYDERKFIEYERYIINREAGCE